MGQRKYVVVDKVLKGDFLTTRQKSVLALRLQGLTLEQIGQDKSIARERVRQIGEKIRVKIFENLTSEELGEYGRVCTRSTGHKR